MKKIFSILFAASCALADTTYLETFDHYRDATVSFNEGTGLSEVYSGYLKTLVFRPQDNGALARQGYFPVEHSPKEKEWTLSWQHSLYGNPAVKDYEMLLFFGDRAKPSMEAIKIDTVNWYYSGAFLAVTDRRARLYLYRDGVSTLANEIKLPAKPFIGWNLRGKKECAVNITSVKVEDGVARRYGDNDLTAFLETRTPAEEESISPDWGVMLPVSKKITYNYTETPSSELLFKMRPASNGVSKLVFTFENGAKEELGFISITRNAWPGRKGIIDESLQFAIPRQRHNIWLFSRPNPSRYEGAQQEELQAAFDKFPHVWQKVWDISLHRCEYRKGYDVYVDGNMLASFTNEHIVAISADGARTAQFAVKETGRNNIEGIGKLDFSKWPDGFALSRVRFNRGGGSLGIREYSGRSAFDAMPSSCHFSVPNRQYQTVRAICSVDTNAPPDYVPEIIARFAKYRGLGYEGPSDQHIDRKAILPKNGEAPVKQEGVSITPLPDGKYRVDFSMDVGKIQDVIYGVDQYDGVTEPFPFLDVEFTACLWEGQNFYVNHAMTPDPFKRSSVIVHSAEVFLPIQCMHVTPKHEYSTYSTTEIPGATVHVENSRGPAAVMVTVKDESGNVVETQKLDFPGGASSKDIEFKTREVGLYYVEYKGYNITHNGRFAIVQDDSTRDADWDSPYYAWTWFGANRTAPGIERNLALLQKFGVRRCDINNRWMGAKHNERPGETDQLFRKYKIHHNQFGYLGDLHVKPNPGESDEAAIDRYVPLFKETAQRFSHTKRALIFHESGGGPYPYEIIGGKTELSEVERISESNRLHQAKLQARAWRKADPSVKLIWGNTVDSIAILASVFRDPETKDLVDFLGEEGVGVSAPPETETALNPWMQKALAKRMGRGDIPVDCPFEWKARMRRCLDWDEHKQAAYCTRDALIAMVLEYSMVPVSVGVEVGSSYFESIWGCGTHSRWPEAYPFLLAPATSTLTYVFDQAKFRKLLQTGSLTIYAPAFTVKNGKGHATAIWTAKGQNKVKLDLGENKSYKLVKMTGRELPDQTVLEIEASEDPVYILTEKPIAAVTVDGKRTFRGEEFAKDTQLAIAVPLTNVAEVVIENKLDERLYDNADCLHSYTAEGFNNKPFFNRDGKFELTSVTDEDKGECLELKDVTGETLAPMKNCCFMKFQNAKPVEGEFDTIGVWVNGNSSWSKLVFEVTDAEGEVWLSAQPGGYGSIVAEWSHTANISFDDWRFVRFPLTADSSVKVLAPGQNHHQWTRDGLKGNGKIDFPIRVTGLAYLSSPWATDLLEMQPVRPAIRLKDISLLKTK